MNEWMNDYFLDVIKKNAPQTTLVFLGPSEPSSRDFGARPCAFGTCARATQFFKGLVHFFLTEWPFEASVKKSCSLTFWRLATPLRMFAFIMCTLFFVFRDRRFNLKGREGWFFFENKLISANLDGIIFFFLWHGQKQIFWKHFMPEKKYVATTCGEKNFRCDANIRSLFYVATTCTYSLLVFCRYLALLMSHCRSLCRATCISPSGPTITDTTRNKKVVDQQKRSGYMSTIIRSIYLGTHRPVA